MAEVGENYRSRISPLRKKRGMNIENIPAFKADGKRTYGSYRYRPNAIGREAADFLPGDPLHGTLFDTHPGAWQR